MRLSVIVLSYNRAAYLEGCLGSLAATDLRDVEFLISDDASTDDSMEVAIDFATRDPRFQVHQNRENFGAIANANKALSRTTGDYLCLFSDDDRCLPGNFERKVELLDLNPNLALVYSLASQMDAHGSYLGTIRRPEYTPFSYVGGRDEFADLLSGNYLPGPTVVFRKTEQSRFDPTLPDTLSDWDLWLKHTWKRETAFIAEPLVCLRTHPGSLSSQKTSEMALGLLPVWRSWLLEGPEIVLGTRAWLSMQATLDSELARCSPERTAEGRREFQRLYDDYLKRMGSR